MDRWIDGWLAGWMDLVKLLYFTGRGSKFIFQGMELSKVVVI